MLETRQRTPPDFSFPPKFQPDLLLAPAIEESRSTGTLKLQNLGYAATCLRKLGNFEPQDLTPASCTHSPFLAIPIEIRLHIYSYVLASHSVFHAHLAPQPEPFSSLNNPQFEDFQTSIIRPLGRSTPTTSILTTNASPAKPQHISALYSLSAPTLVGSSSSKNLRGKIPTGLLVSCKQVYEEARKIPWENDTFSFINWFWSGVYAARQFTRGLRPWQAENMRWVGVEILGRDLADATGPASTSGMVSKWGVVASNAEESDKKSEWIELCELWIGVWGLRLGIKGSMAVKKIDYIEEHGVWGRLEEMAVMEAQRVDCQKGVLNVEKDWVKHGLLQLRSLHWLYLEIEDGDISREDKLRFCADLEGLFNSSGRATPGQQSKSTRVVFVERRRKEIVKNSDFEWFGGEPGNDFI